ncbi:MAG: hypothetical protein JWR27_464 [Aeromicrobium sp.]|nr:hypothetical protein [Aeromicrobium sp.]
MKYDRPVWQIMHACADAMPGVFRYEDVRGWFSAHYPEVNDATIRAHLIGLTEGGRAKHVQFAKRSPVFRRVARGEYAPIPVTERGEDPDLRAPSASRVKMSGNGAHRGSAGPSGAVTAGSAGRTAAPDHEDPGPEPVIADLILLGSVGERVNVPAPAKEVYREVSFQLSRLDAELSGTEWFVLSAEHGLVAPNEWISPDSRTLADMEPCYRVVWASWVVARLQSMVGPLEGMTVRVDAPDAFVGPLFSDLQDAGAILMSGRAGEVTVPVPQPYVDLHAEERGQAGAREMEAREVERLTVFEIPKGAEGDLVGLVGPAAVSPAALHLSDGRLAVPASKTAMLPEAPGLYGWFVDAVGARELNRCLQLPVRPGLVFVGQVGGSSWHSLCDPVLNLRDHVERVHLHGGARASTFRMTLATVLRVHLQMTSLEDPRLTEWMLQHLSVTWWAGADPCELRELAQRVVGELDPPLNVDHLPVTAYRARLNQMRSALV